MTEPITLYSDRLRESPYVFSVFVALREKGLRFESRELDLDRGEQRSSDYAMRSLTSRVPCIDHQGFFLSESLAILEYLEEVFPAPTHPRLLPEELRARARARQILGWLRSDLLPLRDERPTTTMFFERATTPLSAQARAAADKLLRVAEQIIPKGEGDLFGAWSIADADFALMLHRLILNGDEVPERVRHYAQRQWQRASAREFVQLKRPALG
ncbi:MAG: glutathione transferase [Polyangiales bacterium]